MEAEGGQAAAHSEARKIPFTQGVRDFCDNFFHDEILRIYIWKGEAIRTSPLKYVKKTS